VKVEVCNCVRESFYKCASNRKRQGAIPGKLLVVRIEGGWGKLKRYERNRRSVGSKPGIFADTRTAQIDSEAGAETGGADVHGHAVIDTDAGAEGGGCAHYPERGRYRDRRFAAFAADIALPAGHGRIHGDQSYRLRVNARERTGLAYADSESGRDGGDCTVVLLRVPKY
jgi:hypothetical protein